MPKESLLRQLLTSLPLLLPPAPRWPSLPHYTPFPAGDLPCRPAWQSGFAASLCCSKVAGKPRGRGTVAPLPGRLGRKPGDFSSPRLSEEIFMHKISAVSLFFLEAAARGVSLSSGVKEGRAALLCRSGGEQRVLTPFLSLV